jgi:predicted Ser/Thr protein kinase
MSVVADKNLVTRKDGAQEVTSVKNHVLLLEDQVVKSFFAGRRSHKRFAREVRALSRLGDLDGFPELMRVSQSPARVYMSRLAGDALARAGQVPDSVFHSLRERVKVMLSRGVVRHSLPARDVIVRPDGTAGLIDFERSRCRSLAWSPIWLGSCAVTRFQLLRLIESHAPHLLSKRERAALRIQHRLRAVYRIHLNLRRRYKQWHGGVG